jgi:hypothetical protein
MRLKTNPQIQKLDVLHKAKELGEVIKLLSNRSPGHLDLQSLPCPKYGQLTDPVLVTEALKTFFKDWHAIPKNLDPAANQLARNPEYWRTLLHYEETGTPQPLHKRSKIPVPLQDGLRRACAVKVSPEVQDRIHTAVNERITFAEFNTSLNGMPTGKAGGASEVTSNMAKKWSEDTRRLIYAHMENIWTTRSTPAWFKDKVIKLAPKIAGNTELKNMRPISLYEVLRKAWTTIIARRIHLEWHNNDVLHKSQYGYRLDQGTHMALFSVINQIEDANHTKTTKHATFWDIKRAFDSIPRNIQKLAWVRLGVPTDVAEWFVEMDDGGLSFISSPHYHLNKNLKTPQQMKGTNTHFSSSPHLAYNAERGIGQGESASSLMWTALYDILLEWIDPSNRHLHGAERQLYYTDADAAATCPNAYADDLCTITSGPRGEYMQQVQATWLSAFCAFTGMEMHPAKIFSTILGPIPEKYQSLPPHDSLSGDNDTHLLVHDLNWKPIQCPKYPYLRAMKYLGVHLELRPVSDSDPHQQALLDIQTHLSHLLIQPGSYGPKIDYILFKLLPITLNTALCANWTLDEYRALDAPLSKAYRTLLSLPRTFPEALLYLPQSKMGIGLPRLSDKAQIMKWETLLRCLAVGGDPCNSVYEFTERLPPDTTSTVNNLLTISPPHKWPRQKRYTIRSLVEWFEQSKLNMCYRTQQTQAGSVSIQNMAEHLRLWPSEDWAQEDNDNLPPISLVATDGSFIVTPRGAMDILTSEYDLRCSGKGAAGIIFLPPGYSELTSPTPTGIRISSDHPEPGMNAFTWELAAQVIALHLSQHLPNPLVLTSDCTSAITIVNKSIRSHNDTLANERGGVFASAAHQFSHHYHWQRKFTHTKAHPERHEDRRLNPTLEDKAICMADAMAGKTKATLGDKKYPMIRETLKIEHIFDEIIIAGQWHLRTQDLIPFPVLGDVLPFQHSAQLHMYCSQRDRSNTENRWQSTAYALADKIHPAHNRSYWAAARRTVVAFDWIGHGRNRAKITTLPDEERLQTSKCTLCGQTDSQAHCMLHCTHTSFTAIRKTAQEQQGITAREILLTTKSLNQEYFIKQFITASWMSTTQTSRLWLGMWNEDTLSSLLRQTLDSPITLQERRLYITIARKLTAPLLTAYYDMLDVANSRSHTASTVKSSGEQPAQGVITLTPYLRNILENIHIQMPILDAPSVLNHLDHITYTNLYTLTDAAFAIPNAADDT